MSLKYYTPYILILLIFDIYVTVTLVTLFSLPPSLRKRELLDARKRAMYKGHSCTGMIME